ncbi:hypothetical protein D3C71_1971010 [compost metagenome]
MLPGDADGAAADPYLNKIRSGLRQIKKPLPVHHVPRSYLDPFAEGVLQITDGFRLPFRITV